MITKRKTKVVKSIKKDGYIDAFYAETTRSKPYMYSGPARTKTELFVGRFSKSDWRKLKVYSALDFAIGYSPWVMLLLTILSGALGLTVMVIFSNSFIIGLTGLLFCVAGIVGFFVTVIDFTEAKFNESMVRKFIKRIGCMPVRLSTELTVAEFMKVDNETFINHMRKISKEEFLNIVQSFVKWDKAEQAYNELNKTIGYRHEYDDVKLYDFTNEKRQELQEKINKNKAEAKEFEKALGKDTRSAKLVQALQKADNAIAA